MSALAVATTTTSSAILRTQAANSLYTGRRLRWHVGIRHLTNTSVNTTTTTTNTAATTTPPPSAVASPRSTTAAALSRLPWPTLLRSTVITTLMCSPTLLRPSIAALGLVARPRVALLDAETNPVLRRLVRHLVYDQFCAGTTEAEVARTVRGFKALGYRGIILTFAKEIELAETPSPSCSSPVSSTATSSSESTTQTIAAEAAAPAEATVTTTVSRATTTTTTATATMSGRYSQAHYDMVASWRAISLASLRMLQPGDVLAMKMTGAGPVAVDALCERQPMPTVVDEALAALCDEARRRGARLWFDAEQQSVQPGIDDWALELMRRWNGRAEAKADQQGQHRQQQQQQQQQQGHDSSGPLVYNTIQAYLKGSRDVADRHIAAAAAGGWALGIKLVRGAYMEHERRALIHDTKADTDACYDDIADRLISQRMPQGQSQKGGSRRFPAVCSLMLATHNAASTERATARHRARLAARLPTCELECAQVAGMADELGGRLIADYESSSSGGAASASASAPKPYKCLTWGSVGECMGYLHRRAMENRGAVERTKHMAAAMRGELWRRLRL